jgi:putative tryptophan/tyrosine transport system substrate-binding protein
LGSRGVTVLTATGGDASARAAKAATSTIPILFAIGGDPTKAGLVKSFNRPGGNATGVVIFSNDMEAKRLDLLREIVPGVSLFGVLLNPNFPPAAGQLPDLETAAPKRIFIAKASNDSELDAAFAALLSQRVGALAVASDPYFDTRRARIIAFAAKQRLPAIYQLGQRIAELDAEIDALQRQALALGAEPTADFAPWVLLGVKIDQCPHSAEGDMQALNEGAGFDRYC